MVGRVGFEPTTNGLKIRKHYLIFSIRNAYFFKN